MFCSFSREDRTKYPLVGSFISNTKFSARYCPIKIHLTFVEITRYWLCTASDTHHRCSLPSSCGDRRMRKPFYRQLYLGIKEIDTFNVSGCITASIMY